MSLLALLALGPVLVAVALSDVATLRIPNWLVVVALGIFAICAPFLPAGELADRLTASAVAFGLLLPLFAARFLGGGDVKMLPAVVLFVPPEHWQLFGGLLSASLVLGAIAMSLARAATAHAAPTGWLALDQGRTFPMGVSIAASGISLAVVLAFGV